MKEQQLLGRGEAVTAISSTLSVHGHLVSKLFGAGSRTQLFLSTFLHGLYACRLEQFHTHVQATEFSAVKGAADLQVFETQTCFANTDVEATNTLFLGTRTSPSYQPYQLRLQRRIKRVLAVSKP